MRKLTVKREKSFVGCLAKMQVYIEDSCSDGLTMTVMNGEEPEQISCRKIGELKNGEETAFEIGENAARVFVIADKLSKDYCNDCYQLPEGDEDISLSGRNKFNPATGNAFRFNGNDGRVATVGRQRGMKRGLIVLIALVLIGFLLGYGISAAIFAILDGREKVFSAGEMSITLNESFEQQNLLGYSAVYVSNAVEIMVFKNDFSGFGSSSLTAADYAKFVIASDQSINSEVVSVDGLVYYTFDKDLLDGQTYSYFVYTYKADDAYWQFYFAVEKSKAARYADDVAKWAGSVTFN